MIPTTHEDLLTRPIVVSLATQMRDGSIQTQPVWCRYDGRHLQISTLIGRQAAVRRAAHGAPRHGEVMSPTRTFESPIHSIQRFRSLK